MTWTQTQHGFETVTATVPVSGTDATLSGTAPFLRFTDTDSGHEDWRFFVDADLFKLQWLSGTGPDVWTDVYAFSDPAAATRTLTLTDYALYFTGLDAAQVFLRAIVSSEANPRFRIDTNGKEEWGPGGASAVDTALERVAAGVLSTATLRLTATPSDVNDATRKTYVDTADALLLPKSGGTMTGFITLHADPTSAMHAATKQYVDAQTFSPSGDIMTGALVFDLAVAGNIIRSFVASEANPRWNITSNGVQTWGPGGGTAVDTQLSRIAANQLGMASGDQFLIDVGTEALPGLSISGDTNTGIRSSGADILEIVTAGADRWRVNASGHLLAVDDATYDIGASGATRPRDIFLSRDLTVGDQLIVVADALIGTAIEIDGALNHDGSTVGFYNTAPVSQATASANLTDNSGGTANDTVQALTDPADTPATADALRDDLVANLIPELRNNIADLTAKVNKALTVLRNLGLMAT